MATCIRSGVRYKRHQYRDVYAVDSNGNQLGHISHVACKACGRHKTPSTDTVLDELASLLVDYSKSSFAGSQPKPNDSSEQAENPEYA